LAAEHELCKTVPLPVGAQRANLVYLQPQASVRVRDVARSMSLAERAVAGARDELLGSDRGTKDEADAAAVTASLNDTRIAHLASFAAVAPFDLTLN